MSIGGAALTDEYKRVKIHRVIGLMSTGFQKHKAGKRVGHDIYLLEKWADELGIAWPEKFRRKEKP